MFALGALGVALLLPKNSRSAVGYEIPFSATYWGHRGIIVDVQVNGKGPFPFILDSCAGTSSIDADLVAGVNAKTLGQTTVSSGGAKTISTPTVRVDRLRLGKLTPPINNLLALHYSVGAPYRGILGLDFLEQYAVTVDFDFRTVKVTPAVSYRPEPKDVVLPVDFTKLPGIPCIKASVEGHEGWFFLDSGNGANLLLNPGFVKLARLSDHRKLLPGASEKMVTGTYSASTCRIGSLELGPYLLKDQLTDLVTSDSVAPTSLAGNIGIRQISRFLITFDFSRAQIILAPNQRFGEYDRTVDIGIGVYKAEKGYVVTSISSGGAAAAAGLKVGDLLSRIDGVPVVEMDSYTFDDALEGKTGTAFRITVYRKGAKRVLKLVVHERI
jgi:hypothetical protein